MQKHGDRKDTALLVILTNHDALKGVCYKKQFSSKQRAATTLGRRIPRFALIGNPSVSQQYSNSTIHLGVFECTRTLIVS
jgi:hypothetical protein